ncbi:MAG: imelysin family protein [Myxococcales bacterium]|nr:imelysin family protein [Myxococcales bacterium]
MDSNLLGTSSWVLLGALALGALAKPQLGCTAHSQNTMPTDTTLTQAESDLLTDIGPMVVAPTLEQFRTDVVALREALVAWRDGSARENARDPFLAAMLSWQQAEVLQIGPAAQSVSATGGADLRDEIYSWPTVNPCRVDQKTVAGEWTDAGYFEANLVNSYGMDAIGHLLFAPRDDNACPSQVDINDDGTWEALGPEGVDASRADFAVALVDHVLQSADELLDAWSPAGGDFGTKLAEPGTGDSPFLTEQSALEAVYVGLFYLEIMVKDRKLAEPLGLGDCSDDCASRTEGAGLGVSTAWVAANLRGFRLAFTGGEGGGFDDLLAEQGHSELADRMIANTDAAIALADGLGPYDELVVHHAAAAQSLYDAVKAVTDDLKGDFATVMSLQVPSEAAGDND